MFGRSRRRRRAVPTREWLEAQRTHSLETLTAVLPRRDATRRALSNVIDDLERALAQLDAGSPEAAIVAWESDCTRPAALRAPVLRDPELADCRIEQLGLELHALQRRQAHIEDHLLHREIEINRLEERIDVLNLVLGAPIAPALDG